MDRPVVLGVDGGGTSGRLLAATDDGTQVGRADLGPLNAQRGGPDDLVTVLVEALADLEVPVSQVQQVVIGLAGAGNPATRRAYEAALCAALPGAGCQVLSDLDLLLSVHPNGVGYAVIAGTGAVAVGRAPDRQQRVADGVGFLFGDLGSGFWIGREAVARAFAAADGRGPATVLRETIPVALGFERLAGVLGLCARGQVDVTRIAGLAIDVDDAASSGDAVAQQLLDQAGAGLADTLAAVCQQLSVWDTARLAVTGGVLLGSTRVRAAFDARLGHRGVSFAAMDRIDDVAAVAVALARQAMGTPPG